MVDHGSMRVDRRWRNCLRLIRWMERETSRCPPPRDQIFLRGDFRGPRYDCMPLANITYANPHLWQQETKASYVAHPTQGSCVSEGTKRPKALRFKMKQRRLHAIAIASFAQSCANVRPPELTTSRLFFSHKAPWNVRRGRLDKKASRWKGNRSRIHTSDWILTP